MAEPHVVLDLGRLRRLKDFIRRRSARANKLILQWTREYAAFIRKRFRTFSRGGGNWPRLKPETIARKGSSAILVDTGQMFQRLAPELVSFSGVKAGSHPFKATATFGGESHYPDGSSVADVMSYHQEGRGHLPVRRILVPPDGPTKKRMAEQGKKAMREAYGQR